MEYQSYKMRDYHVLTQMYPVTENLIIIDLSLLIKSDSDNKKPIEWRAND